MPGKKEIRKQILQLRDSLSQEERTVRSAFIAGWLQQLPSFKNANCILAYRAFRSEASLDQLIDEGLFSEKLAFPRMVPATRELEVVPAERRTRFEANAYGILEPAPQMPAISPAKVDLVLLPGVAFAASGVRLGYGGGYYDRLLPMLRADALKIGVCFELQRVPDLPAEPHDIPVDGLVTETGFYIVNPVKFI